MSEDILALLQLANIAQSEQPKIVKNKALSSRLVANIKAANITTQNPGIGALLLKLSQKELKNADKVARFIGLQKINTMEQLDGAISFISSNSEFILSALEEAAGVGVTITDEQIQEVATEVVKSNLRLVKEKGKKASLGDLMNIAKAKLKFAPRQKLVTEINAELAKITDEELSAVEKPNPLDSDEELSFQGIVASFPEPKDNAMQNSPDIQEKHLQETGGQIYCRFPPEPNGWIHIGHAKAMLLDFGYAQAKKGVTYMRFDDTNPAKEKDEFIEGIKKDVKWMGWTWWKLTHTSDYFPELYEFAIVLIKKGLAYVDHSPKEDIKRQRSERTPSPYRDTPPEENLRKFYLMKSGYYESNAVTLRLKMDYKHDNPNMRDQIAYRIIYNPHPRTSDKWCIYPTYDYSHCVVDSIENVTHSLCTLEFECRRDSYYWVLDALNIFKPFVWEFSRLNLTHTVMSKRRLQTLVYKQYVRGWDDPRMPTIAGLRRRGFTSSAIRDFCSKTSFTRNVTTIIEVATLERCQSRELDISAPRYFVVLDPLKITLRGFEKTVVEAPILPKDPNSPKRHIPISSEIYIESEDFMEVPTEDFYRLSLNSHVGLKYINVVIKVVDVIKEGTQVKELVCEVVPDGKAQVYIHWVSDEAVKAEVRLFDDLFKTPNVGKVVGDWINDFNPNSLVVKTGALIEKDLVAASRQEHFQFERLGYFVYDEDTTDTSLVFNRIIPLKPRAKEAL